MIPREDLFRLTGVGVVQTDIETGRLLRANQAFCKMLGYDETELQGMTNAELTHPEDWQRDSERFAALQRGELTEDTAVTRVLHKDGHVMWLELNITIMGEGDQVTNLTVATDVTSRVRSEAKLHENEMQLRLGYSLAGLGIWNWDLVTGAGHLDDVAAAIIGLPAGQLENVAEAQLASIHPDDVGRIQAEAAAGIASDAPFDLDYRVVHADGQVRHVASRAQVFTDEAGRPVRLVGTNRDVTAERENEGRQTFLLKLSDALRAEPDTDAVTDRALRMLFEQLRLDRCYVGVYRLADDRGDFTHQVGNDRVPPVPDSVRLSDFPDALRSAFDQTLVIDDVAETECLSEGDRRNLAAFGMRALIAATLRKGENNSDWSIVLVSAQPRRWTPGEIELAEEVTERTWAAVSRARAEEALRASEEQLQLTVESVPDYAIFTTDPEGVITTWNAGAEQVFDYSEGEIIGQQIAVLFTLEDQEAGVPATESSAAREHGKATDDRWHIRKDGTRFFASGMVAPLWRGEKITGYVKIARDLTQQQQAEEEREMLFEAVQDFNAALERRVAERTEELARSNTRFTQAFTLAPFAATISTLGKPEIFLEVNEAFLELTRYKREEIIGKTALDLKMWSSSQDQHQLAKAQKDGRGFRDLALQLIDSEGNLLDILLSAEVIHTDGQENYLKMFYDITEKRRSDEQMTLAVGSLMAEASWFSQGFVARLNHIRSGGKIEDYQPVGLSTREREVLRMVALGWTNKRISEELELKQQTIRNYLSNIFDKINVHSRTEAVVWARERGLIG